MTLAVRTYTLRISLGIVGLTMLLAQTNPQREMWKAIKEQLKGPRGEEYFASVVKDTKLPPLEGAVIASLVNEGVSNLVLDLSDGDTPEVTLLVHHLGWRIKKVPAVGSRVVFSGVARTFTPGPFMLSFDVDKEETKGLPFERVVTKK